MPEQKGGICCKYQGQTHNLPPLNIPEGPERRRPLLRTFQSSQAQIWLCPRQIHPEPHLRKRQLSMSTPPFHQKHQRVQTKVGSAAIWSNGSQLKQKKKPGTTLYTSNKTLDSFQSPKRERQQQALPASHTCPLAEGL